MGVQIQKRKQFHDDDSKHDLGLGSSNMTQMSGSLQGGVENAYFFFMRHAERLSCFS